MSDVSIRAVAIGLSLVLGAAAGGQGETEATRLRREIHGSFERQDPARAAELIDRYLERFPRDPVMLYNAACARCRLGELDGGGRFLLAAVKAGFRDFSHMRRDPDLRPLREHPVYRALLDARDAADPLLSARRLERWRERFGESRYRFETDSRTRIHYVTALDDDRRLRMRRTLEQLDRRLGATLFLPPDPGSARHHVLVAVLAPADAAGFFDDPHARGVYRHAERELIATGAGRTLRHEFVHALHHGHMDAVGQEHPVWIQEGLACLYESFEIQDDDSIVVLPNERRNIAKRLDRTGRLLALRELFASPPQRFSSHPGPLYAQARSIFEFLADEGLLEAWYETYVRRFDDDPLGATALEIVFGQPLDVVEERWRAWLDSAPLIVPPSPSEPAGSC